MTHSSFSHLTGQLSAHNRRSLETLREKVAIAEGSLRNARDQLESEVAAQGLPVKGLFGSCYYVSRSSAESWLADAKHEANARELAALRKLAEKTGDPDEPDDNEGDDSDRTPPKNKKAKKKVWQDDEAEEDSPVDAYHAHVSKVAAGIIRAGERRRGSNLEPIKVADPPWIRPGASNAYEDQVRATAAAIVRAGEKRRGK